MAGRRFLPLLLLALVIGCESNNQPPTPSPGPGNGGSETITGRERIGWDQAASSQAELATFRYAIYVDGVRSELADVTCASAAAAAGFPCSGRLPAMSAGSHVLELAAFFDSDGIIESARSSQLRVTVTGATSPVADVPLAPGDVVTTTDGLRLEASVALDGLQDVVDLAIAPGGTVLVAERTGGVVIISSDPARPPFRASSSGPLLSAAAAPDFAASGQVFVIHEDPGVLRLTRYRLVDTQLVERVRVIRDIPATSDVAAAVRFGPDTKLYAAFDSGGSVQAATRPSDWRGKLLRLNPDGSTPDDQPAASPVHWQGLASPRAMDWSAAGLLWMAERGHDGVERLRAVATDGQRPRRAGLRGSYVLPGNPGAASVSFHDGTGAPSFAGSLFVAARDAGYLLRVTFDEVDGSKPITSEKLLQGRLGEVRAVGIAPDGVILVATPSAVWRLAPVR